MLAAAKALVEVVEAAYRPAGTTEEWLQELVNSLARVMNRGFGVGALVVDLSRGAPSVLATARTDDCPDVARIAPEMNALMSSADARRLYRAPSPVGTAVRSVGREAFDANEAVQRWFRPLGIRDTIGISACDGSPRSLVLTVPTGKSDDLSRDEARRLAQVAGHLSAGLRLRHGAPGNDVGQATVAPNGTVLDAQPQATSPATLAALRAHALAVERARTRPGEGALDLWRVLADATWSLVETFDRDGRRYYLARENPVNGIRSTPLAPREGAVLALLAAGHPNKLIAYELGLTPSTVSSLVRSAMAKLGLTRRADLVKLLLGVHPSEPQAS